MIMGLLTTKNAPDRALEALRASAAKIEQARKNLAAAIDSRANTLASGSAPTAKQDNAIAAARGAVEAAEALHAGVERAQARAAREGEAAALVAAQKDLQAKRKAEVEAKDKVERLEAELAQARAALGPAAEAVATMAEVVAEGERVAGQRVRAFGPYSLAEASAALDDPLIGIDRDAAATAIAAWGRIRNVQIGGSPGRPSQHGHVAVEGIAGILFYDADSGEIVDSAVTATASVGTDRTDRGYHSGRGIDLAGRTAQIKQRRRALERHLLKKSQPAVAVA